MAIPAGIPSPLREPKSGNASIAQWQSNRLLTGGSQVRCLLGARKSLTFKEKQ